MVQWPINRPKVQAMPEIATVFGPTPPVYSAVEFPHILGVRSMEVVRQALGILFSSHQERIWGSWLQVIEQHYPRLWL